jgi:hypothetical protein
MMFADAENVQTNLFGVFNPVNQMAQCIRSVTREVSRNIRECSCEAVNANLHLLG